MRFIPLTESDKVKMLKTIGAGSVDELFADIPEDAGLDRKLNLPAPLPEPSLIEYFEKLSAQNNQTPANQSFLGAGAYRHHVPAAVDQLLLRGELFTAYTPYQPEVSQGTLMTTYEFQTYTAALLGMDIANASMYDGASSLAEAVIMAKRVTRKNRVVMSSLVHPHWREVAATYTQDLDVEIVVVECAEAGKTSAKSLVEVAGDGLAAIVIQYPNFMGCLEDLESIRKVCDDTGALMIVAVAEPVAMGIIEPPGRFGADIVVAEGRSFGNSVSYGGPGLGMFATKDKWARQIPGRLVGKTNDLNGERGYVLTLATREQHIRREKATSNICSNQALCATAAAIHISLLGRTGLRELAVRNLTSAKYLADKLSSLKGFQLLYDHPFFNEVAVKTPLPVAALNEKLSQKGFTGGFDLSSHYPSLENAMLFCATETHAKEDIDRLVDALSEIEK